MAHRMVIASRSRQARVRADHARVLPGPSMVRVATAWSVILGILGIFLAVRLTGGSPNPLNHLGYFPIVLAAYVFGIRGGVASALFAGLVLGPFAWWTGFGGPIEGPDVSLFRAGMFLLAGLLTGILFARVRSDVRKLQRAAVVVAQRQRDGMVALARSAEAKDQDTGDHVLRVQRISETLANAAGLDAPTADEVGWSAMLHDIGKLHVPDRILLKPSPLTSAEWAIMRLHPIWGAEILEHGAGFEIARRIARWHHENVDGSGYPDGLRGDAIPLEARIVRIADSFDAMTTDRPYQAARSCDYARSELKRYAGSWFDPDLVTLFLELLEADPALVERLRLVERGVARLSSTSSIAS